MSHPIPEQSDPPSTGDTPGTSPVSGPQRPSPQAPPPGYDQQAPADYPPQAGPAAGYPSQPGYPPQDVPQGGYPPQPQGYPPQQPGYPPQQFQPGYAPAVPGPVSDSDEKLWGLLAHISIPFLGFVGPLVVYLIYKDRSRFLQETSVEALNFSILYTIAQIVSSALVTVLIGAVLLPLVFIGGLVLCILAALAANKHELYRYPINWRLVK